MTHWTAAYVGLPWRPMGRDRAGVDCWGLVRLVHAELLGVALPAHDGVDPADGAAVAAGLAQDSDWVRVERPQAFDVVVFRRGRDDRHVGVMIDAMRFLHADHGGGRIDHLNAIAWRSRVVAFGRHRSRVSA
jgi:cell wall-associated NlpC family hydrolase